jgi:hypothetical protein
MAPCPVYPPGVLQTFTIPDPTSLDGFGELEITLIPSRGVTDINHISAEGITAFKEMLYEADEEYRKTCSLKMDAIQTHINRFDEFAERTWYFNRTGADLKSWAWLNQEGPYDCSDCGWISYMDVPHFRDEYTAYIDDEIAEVLTDAEEDADYEEWINSNQYVMSLKEYNRHKLLSWDKESEGEHPRWSGEYKELQQWGSLTDTELLNAYIKERYRVEVDVDELHWAEGGRHYAFGRTPYGDVYIPQKITEYLKDNCGIYEMDIALQDVERRGEGARLRSFPWTCVYLHNNGFSLE